MVYIEKESETYVHSIKHGRNIFLYLIAVLVNIACFTCGTAFAWSSPVIPKLGESSENPLGHPLSEDEISWLASLLALGAGIGPFAAGVLSDKVGRKITFIITSIPMIISHLTLAFSTNLHLFYFARFMKGACVGIFLTVIPIYLGEIAEVHNRGTIGCFTLFFITVGSLYAFAVGPYISLFWFNLSIAVQPMIFIVIVMIFVPESPCFLVLKGRHEEAKRNLMKLRQGSIVNEFGDIVATVKESSVAKGSFSDIIQTKYLRNGLVVSMGLLMIQQITAISAIIFYLQLIFDQTNANISPEIAAIIAGVVQILGTFASTITVEKLGRKPLLLISGVFISVSLVVLSVYFYLLLSIDVSGISWLPIFILMVHIFFYNIGIGPLSFAVMGEIFPPHIKSLASALSVSCCYLSCFAVTKIFPILASLIGTWFGFLVFAIGNTLSIVFIWFRVPETKGKTLAEILDHFK